MSFLKEEQRRSYDDFDLETINQFKINLEQIKALDKTAWVSSDDNDIVSQRFYNNAIQDHLEKFAGEENDLVLNDRWKLYIKSLR